MEQLLTSMNLHEIIIIFFFSSLSSWVFRIKKFFVRAILGHEGGLFSSGLKQASEEKREKDEEMKLSKQEMKVVMEVMGIHCDGFQGGVSTHDLEGLFNVEPSLEEVEEAFSLFDLNLDGFIDEEELHLVLSRLGFQEASSLESCRRMIKAYDNNRDGKIDFSEFVKCLEGSFSCC